MQSTKDLPTTVVLCLAGELDLTSAPALTAAFDQVILDRCPEVVVDLSAVSFIDCAVLGRLVRARNQLHHCGGELTVRDPSPRARRVLELTRLDDLIEGER